MILLMIGEIGRDHLAPDIMECLTAGDIPLIKQEEILIGIRIMDDIGEILSLPSRDHLVGILQVLRESIPPRISQNPDLIDLPG